MLKGLKAAKDYAIGMWKILQYKKPDDFVLATNKTTSIKIFRDLFKEF